MPQCGFTIGGLPCRRPSSSDSRRTSAATSALKDTFPWLYIVKSPRSQGETATATFTLMECWNMISYLFEYWCLMITPPSRDNFKNSFNLQKKKKISVANPLTKLRKIIELTIKSTIQVIEKGYIKLDIKLKKKVLFKFIFAL